MIFELYLFLQVIAVLLLAACFVTKTPLASVLTAFTSAILIAGAWVLEMGHTYVWNAATRAYVAEPVYQSTVYLPWINVMIFAIALLFFIYDMFIAAKEESEGTNSNVNLQGGGHGFKQ